MKPIYIILSAIIINGCNSTGNIINNAYSNLCSNQPSSMSCIKHEDNGYYPSYKQVYDVAIEMYSNFTYETDMSQYGVEEYWFDNEITSIPLKGDCDDISLTFISQLLINGVKPSSIRLVASGVDGKLKHYYVKVKLDSSKYFDFYKIDKYTDIMYMQYDNIGVFIK